MKFSIQLPTDRVEALADFGTADAIATLARKIEKSGFDACFVTEHPFPTDRWLATLGVESVGAFNRACVSGRITTLIRVAEGFHEKRVSQVADAIATSPPPAPASVTTEPSGA